MKKTAIQKNKLLMLGVLAFAFAACDDAAPGSGGSGDKDTGVADTGTSGRKDTGTADQPCDPWNGDSDCGEDEYCDTSAELCKPGCRLDKDGNDNCPEGEFCDEQDRTCKPPSCEGNDDLCGATQYCGPNDICVDGCRVGQRCETTVEGRDTVCSSNHECVPVFPCCDSADSCTELPKDDCTGRQLTGVLSCNEGGTNPCEILTCEQDENCGAGEYCHQESGLCAEGCRLGVECLDGNLSCDPDTHTCVEVSCPDGDSSACEAWQFCDSATELCREGCRDDSGCRPGRICRQGICEDQPCDPEAPDICGSGICREDIRICDEPCSPTSNHCAAHEACNYAIGQCVEGACQDDFYEPNDTVAQATQLHPVAIQGGFRLAEQDDLVICHDNRPTGGDDPSDYFYIDLAFGERLQVTLLNPTVGEANLDLELYTDDDPAGVLVADAKTLNEREVIEFPLAHEGARNATRYYIRVYSDSIGESRAPYTLRALVAPAGNSCFPDEREPNDNNAQGATPLFAGNQLESHFYGSICSDDEDWFQANFGAEDGFTITVSAPQGSDAISVELFSATGLSSSGLNAPIQRVSQPVARPDGREYYTITVAENSGTLHDDTYYIRLRGMFDGTSTSYELEAIAVRTSSRCIGADDPLEPNNSFQQAVNLDTFAGISQGGRVTPTRDHQVATGLGICPQDSDWFCLQADANNVLSAWLVSNDQIGGKIAAHWVNREGTQVGNTVEATAGNAQRQTARASAMQAGTYCLVVEGNARGTEGTYTLNVRRDTIDPDNICELDVSENPSQGGSRNDRADLATPMLDVGPEGREAQRYVFEEGMLCNQNNAQDVDWYSFPVQHEDARVCVMLGGFDHDVTDIDMQLYRVHASEEGTNCNNDATCGAMGACIAGKCRSLLNESITRANVEMIDRHRSIDPKTGAHYVKVYRSSRNGAEGMENPQDYRVQATVVPNNAPAACQADWHELGQSNDSLNNATYIGSGDVAFCDTWLCGSEANAGDWYELLIPRGENRTVFTNHNRARDGDLVLNFFGTALLEGQINGADHRMIVNTLQNNHCLNIQGSPDEDRIVYVYVTGQPKLPPSAPPRLDYSLQVVNSDLGAATPTGMCTNLGAFERPACAPNIVASGLATNCWPTIPLE